MGMTIVCTREEFNRAVCDFRKVMCSTDSTQNDVALAHKCLVLHYLGMEGVTDEEVESAAMILEATTMEAMRRGWYLLEPNLERADD